MDKQKGPSAAAIGLALMAMTILGAYLWLRPSTEPLPDFSEIEDIDQRKTAFFSYLAPIVVEENERVLAQRARLLELTKQPSEKSFSPLQRRWLRKLAAEYELEWPGESREQTMATMLRRIDAVPASLALIQAAKESGWGQSRFAVKGNNLFGHWCYSPGCGIVPARRSDDAAHEVAAFDSVEQSVERYINNLNTHPSYQPLRELRQTKRLNGNPLKGLALADGLVLYSERRGDYVRDIKQMLLANQALIEQAIGEASGEEQKARTNSS